LIIVVAGWLLFVVLQSDTVPAMLGFIKANRIPATAAAGPPQPGVENSPRLIQNNRQNPVIPSVYKPI
jgi:hypothetical protein